MTSLDGQVAIITGATSGIGLATAEALARDGVRLVLHGRREALLAGHAARLPGTIHLAGDIADPATPARLVAMALERFGRLDIAFNNAGLIAQGGVAEIDLDAVTRMIRVNVEAATRFAYTTLKHFVAQGTGQLLNTSSVLGTKTRPLSGAYSGTKFAIEALSEALRMELAGTGVRVMCVEPGLVVTDLHRDHAVRPEVVQKIARPLRPEDVAAAVVFALKQPAHVLVPRVLVLPADQAI